MSEPWNAGKEWAELRARLKMSREKFAKHVGLTPGAVWRIEAKGVFKPGELEKLRAVVQDPSTPTPAPTAAVTVPVPIEDSQDDLAPTITPVPSGGALVLIGSDIASYALDSVTEPEIVGLREKSPYELFLEDGIRRYSNSEIQTFKRCRRKWYLAYYLMYHIKNESPVGPRAVGDRLHRALRWHYHPDPTQRRDVRDALEIIIKLDHEELRKRFAPEIIPLSLESKFAQDADLERIMVAGYVEWVEETGADAEFVVTGAEEYVEVDLPALVHGQTVRIIGRLDARVRRVSDGVRLLLDHKSVASFDGPTRLLNMHEQMKMYILLEQLRGLQTGDRVDGAIFNMMRRCKRTVKANPPFYKRVEVRHNPIAITNFAAQLAGVIERIEDVREALDGGADPNVVVFPTPMPDCVWSCDFLPLDSLMDDGSHWTAMANAFYQVGDPTSYYTKANVLELEK